MGLSLKVCRLAGCRRSVDAWTTLPIIFLLFLSSSLSHFRLLKYFKRNTKIFPNYCSGVIVINNYKHHFIVLYLVFNFCIYFHLKKIYSWYDIKYNDNEFMFLVLLSKIKCLILISITGLISVLCNLNLFLILFHFDLLFFPLFFVGDQLC